jgi:hypothetical protein
VPRKSKEGSNNGGKILFSQLKQVWTDVDMARWHSYFAETLPDHNFTIKGPHIKGRCPFHEDATPSFVVTPNKRIATCFGCHKIFSNPINLLAGVGKTSFANAIVFARKRWGLKAAIPEALSDRYAAYEEHQKNKNNLMELFGSVLFEAMGEYANGGKAALVAKNLEFAETAIEYLKNRRLGESAPGELVAEEDRSTGEFDQFGAWHAMTGRGLIGILPPRYILDNKIGGDSPLFKFYHTYFGAAAEGQQNLGWLVFPYDDAPDSVCRFKIREPRKATPDAKPGQLWIDDSYEEEMGRFRGFYGLRYYNNFLSMAEHGDDGPKEGHVAMIKEGEFDTLAAIAHQVRRGSEDYISLSLSGGAAESLNNLENLGIRRAWIVPDRDGGGTHFARAVLSKTRSRNISFRVFQWPDEYTEWADPKDPLASIKDADEAIKRVGYPRWVRYVCDATRYWMAHEWCFDQASSEVSKGNLSDIQFVARVAAEWGKLLHEGQVLAAYCDAIAKAFGLDASVLKQDLLADDDTEDTFIERLGRVLLEHFHIVGRRPDGHKSVVRVWHKESRETSEIVLNDEKSIENLIARHYGRLDLFVKEKLNEPRFLVPESDETQSFNVTTKLRKYQEFLNIAMKGLMGNVKPIDEENVRAQGIHTVDSGMSHMKSYLVNGRDVFKIEHNGTNVIASRLEGPSDGGVVFENTGASWCDFVKSEADIVSGKDVDLVDIYTTIRDMITTGWSFKYQDVDATFMTLYVMCLGVMTVFPRQTSVMLSAEAGSGKSRFTHGFIGRHQFPNINVVAHSKSMPGFTPAGIKQQHGNTSLALCLEEFEDTGGNDKKSLNTRHTLEMLRDLISEAPVKITQGTATGTAKTYYLRFPLAVSAIKPLRGAADRSRFIHFEMAKSEGHGDPNVTLPQMFGLEKIRKTRREVLLGAIHHMLELRNLSSEVALEYSSGSKLPKYAESRYREALYPLLAMLKLLERLAKAKGMPSAIPDYTDFAYRFTETRKEYLTQLTTVSENEMVFQTILSAPIQIAVAGDHEHATGSTNVKKMLLDINNLDAINKTSQGVFIDSQMEWLIVNWMEACQGLLSNTQYRTESAPRLKQFGERSPYSVKTDDVKASGVMERMFHVMGPCQTIDMISVFSVKHILDEVRTHMERKGAQSALTDSRNNVDTSVPAEDGDVVV